MSSFRPKLALHVTQKQILSPGLVQMVSVLALNKLERKDMINAEMTENLVLEELDGTVPLLDDVAGREESRLATPERRWSRRPGIHREAFCSSAARRPRGRWLRESLRVQSCAQRPRPS